MSADFEKLGAFYLGREYDPATGALRDDLVLYDSRDLTTHAVCVGMTGSGKTGLCLSLLEEAAIDGIPAICIDPKGDLANLLLTFPELAPADFEPWVDAGEAQRKGMSVPELAFVMVYMHLFNYFLIETVFGGDEHYGVRENQAIDTIADVFMHGMLRNPGEETRS